MLMRSLFSKMMWLFVVAAIGLVLIPVHMATAAYIITPSAYWQLNEADPSTGASDETGTVNGTCSACPASVTGQVGNAFDFSGGSVDISFADDAIFDFAAVPSGFSIELWMKLGTAPAIGTPDVIMGRFDATGTQWWIGVQPDGTVAASFADSSSTPPGDPQLNGYSNVTDDNWHHIAVVRNGGAETISLYIDGVLEAAFDTTSDDDFDGDFGATVAVTLGQLASSFYYAGAIDEVAVYNTALSAATIGQHAGGAVDQAYCNSGPTINSTAITTATEDDAYSYTATATDPEGHDVTWSLTTAPSGMTINDTSGVVSWTPGDGIASADVVILATDEFGATDTQTFTITVTAVNDAPVITGQATLETAQGTALTITLGDLTVTDPDNTYPTDFTLTVQSGTNYTASGATITPDAGFTGDLTVPVTVNDGTVDSAVFNLTVTVTSSSSGGGGGGGGSCFIETLTF